MPTPIPLTDVVVKTHCRACGYAGCPQCQGRGFALVDPYRHGGGEAGDDFADLPGTDGVDPAHVAAMREAIGQQVTCAVPVATWRSLITLVGTTPNDADLGAAVRALLTGAGHG